MPDQTGPIQILIVDDNEDNLDLLQRRLQRRGFRAAIARNGREAIARARQLSPRLILMDLEMPVMSGFLAARELRADESMQDTVIAALTAHASSDVHRDCSAAGFDRFVTKPVDFAALLALIAEVGIAPDPALGPNVCAGRLA